MNKNITCEKRDCVMYRNGKCTALDDTDFGNRVCSFYKTKEDVMADYNAIRDRKRTPIVSAEKPRNMTLMYLAQKLRSLGMEV